MRLAIDAIYESGSFRPLQSASVPLKDGERVRITVENESEPEILRLAAAVYDGLTPEEIDEIEAIATNGPSL